MELTVDIDTEKFCLHARELQAIVYMTAIGALILLLCWLAVIIKICSSAEKKRQIKCSKLVIAILTLTSVLS